jgi:hypothetical protein
MHSATTSNKQQHVLLDASRISDLAIALPTDFCAQAFMSGRNYNVTIAKINELLLAAQRRPRHSECERLCLQRGTVAVNNRARPGRFWCESVCTNNNMSRVLSCVFVKGVYCVHTRDERSTQSHLCLRRPARYTLLASAVLADRLS